MNRSYYTPNSKTASANHHEQDQACTDSNYAGIFILWDRLLGTNKYKPADRIKFGRTEFRDPSRQTFWFLLKSPLIGMNPPDWIPAADKQNPRTQ